jgi:molybdopterin-guanine dinucleotide biosynthesis protein A
VRLRCTGVILAGGRGRRFNGRDKGLLRWRRQPLAAAIASRLALQVDDVRVSIARNASRYRAMRLHPIADRVPGHPGPLMGLASAMARIRTPYLVTLPCDDPDVPADYVQRLGRRLRIRHADICFVIGDDGSYPLHALVKTRLRASLIRYLREGGTDAHGWIAKQRSTSVRLNVTNLNEPADLRTRTIKGRRQPNL